MVYQYRQCFSANLPLKVQATSIKNHGKNPIYLLGIDDDFPVSGPMMLAFSIVVVDPGQEVDVSNHPGFAGLGQYSHPDQDISIHSLDDIDVYITSDDWCERWQSDPHHPWNGAPLANGSFTFKHRNLVTSANGISGPTTAPINVIPGPVSISLPPASNFQPSHTFHIKHIQPIEFLDIEIGPITRNTPKCTCGEKGNRTPGKCSSWCDLVLDANKQIL